MMSTAAAYRLSDEDVELTSTLASGPGIATIVNARDRCAGARRTPACR